MIYILNQGLYWNFKWQEVEQNTCMHNHAITVSKLPQTIDDKHRPAYWHYSLGTGHLAFPFLISQQFPLNLQMH